MKKLIIVALVFVCAFSVFATKNSINVKLSPLVTQFSTTSEFSEVVTSENGFGVETAYKRIFIAGFFGEGGFAFHTVGLPEGRTRMNDFYIFTGGGYEWQFGRFKIIPRLDIGLDLLVYDKACSSTFTLMTGFDFGFSISKTFDITLGLDGTFGFSGRNRKSYGTYRIIPTIGTAIKF